ncbi:MAG TPA: phosphoribosylformylglycinamidine synthase subunit PurQ [Planctomycetes bacterium]|nr:phosphoribosylformylglycinamidine synthase subunit PurQ [Planctomycetota bacterium]HIK61399.1 phosphoribosylformylglycinamidine synthase subunit PurQ [Planctomycetota bacterium]
MQSPTMPPPETSSHTPRRPRALVLRTSGTNCEIETARALDLGGAQTDVLHFNRVIEHPELLDPYGIWVFAGGFSYGDDLAAGRVWGMELRTRLGEQLRAHVERGGLALGVCNGFQVLVESGIFEPNEPAEERSVALYSNASNHYECRWVELESADCCCPWLEAGERMPVPVAHAEGRFVVRDHAVMERLIAGKQVALRYVRPSWADSPAGGEDSVPYPYNPNGAAGDVAGICDPSGRVLGLMPHPERNLDPWNHPHWTRHATDMSPREVGEGLAFYRRMVEVAESALV